MWVVSITDGIVSILGIVSRSAGIESLPEDNVSSGVWATSLPEDNVSPGVGIST